MSPAPIPGSSRAHPALSAESIVACARSLLHDEGAMAITINGVGRALGVSGPALYRHVDSLSALLDLLVATLYAEVTEQMVSGARDLPADQRLFSLARTLRHWALANQREFQFLFNSPTTTGWGDPASPPQLEGQRFGAVFLEAFADAVQGSQVPLLDAEISPGDREQLILFAQRSEQQLSPQEVAFFLEMWIEVYGHITMEALGQMSYALSDMSGLFESRLARLQRVLNGGGPTGVPDRHEAPSRVP